MKQVFLMGPTASGKSQLAIKLAQHFNGEIINADSMQIYKEISILTSKPNSQDTKIIKHHFLQGVGSSRKGQQPLIRALGIHAKTLRVLL